MLRSGTSLAQILLTNHPQLFVARQPFFQLYVDVRRIFIEEHGLTKILPLDDEMDSDADERRLFKRWLGKREFDRSETDRLVADAATGKGGGAAELSGTMAARPGTFHDISRQLHALLAERLGRGSSRYIGSKEVLCEAYVPALLEASTRCLMIVRDPRAVIASASHGRYLQSVGDRYPLLMLIRLWRKSAAYWLAFRNHPGVHAIRYEDLVQSPNDVLHEIATWLGVREFPDDLSRRPLRDHAGNMWQGNSSFGDKIGVEPSGHEAWRKLLDPGEIRFIEACTKPEMTVLGYSINSDLSSSDITTFVEDVSGVRAAYLSSYRMDSDNRALEAQRWELGERGAFDGVLAARLFLFPDAYAGRPVARRG